MLEITARLQTNSREIQKKKKKKKNRLAQLKAGIETPRIGEELQSTKVKEGRETLISIIAADRPLPGGLFIRWLGA